MISDIVIAIVIGYLLGSIPSAYLAGRLRKGVDIREVGSKNMGAMNVFYQVGPMEAVLVTLADLGKGVGAILLVRWVSGNPLISPFDFLTGLAGAAAIIFYVETAKRGKKLFVRKIAGLEAIDEAVGRATEMGRPVLFIPGISDMDDVQTLAALTILGRVSRTIADYDSKIFMPVSRSLVMTAARETIKTSYQAAGRPDAYSDDMVNYVTDEQFGYVAAVDGLMVREKPATVFLLGAFFAESLILAETGNSIGAIQIAGTARPAQLPFFIAACDFTLIGEELFAASAYLSGEPRMLGSLKGQDVGKAIAMITILLGVVAVTLSEAWDVGIMTDLHAWLVKVFSSS